MPQGTSDMWPLLALGLDELGNLLGQDALDHNWLTTCYTPASVTEATLLLASSSWLLLLFSLFVRTPWLLLV